jgi:hypothetical protein
MTRYSMPYAKIICGRAAGVTASGCQPDVRVRLGQRPRKPLGRASRGLSLWHGALCRSACSTRDEAAHGCRVSGRQRSPLRVRRGGRVRGQDACEPAEGVRVLDGLLPTRVRARKIRLPDWLPLAVVDGVRPPQIQPVESLLSPVEQPAANCEPGGAVDIRRSRPGSSHRGTALRLRSSPPVTPSGRRRTRIPPALREGTLSRSAGTPRGS